MILKVIAVPPIDDFSTKVDALEIIQLWNFATFRLASEKTSSRSDASMAAIASSSNTSTSHKTIIL